ncbi:hypothetical protein PTTG_07091 [Puccinia triticina 1-1 BBBD Race 1]|uniref:Retrotransposon gag domain-containing protein n=1 Tax=Puccinia triticina (isolate 1-1 / race 1 (BBBD)) TaxID=630390 RepID=A0A0C4EVU8_PUCT1|nr:hypothetical protein PTTG_07091 [Puccinia triticina 1-1 BBBD Race 1]
MSQGVGPDEGRQRDVDWVVEQWPYSNCPTYDGHKTTDVWRWLDALALMLEIRHAHRDIWHLVGIRLLTGPALDALAQALASPVGPRDWTRFCRWAKTLNPLPPLLVQAYNRSLVQDEYQKLRQGEQETAEHFYHRFTHWELRAMYHHCNYEPRSAFLECLNAHLRPKVCSRMDDFKRYNLPIVFGDVVTAALNEDSSE